jgi:oligopeptide transport system ATP-binding protein
MQEEIILKVENLCKYFKKGKIVTKAVDGVSFEIKRGEVFSLVGESGCGKTTTGRAIIGLEYLTDGRVIFKGETIRAGANCVTDKREWKEQNKGFVRGIQMIFQDPVSSLNPRMKVKDIVAEGLIVGGEREKKEIDKRVYDILKRVGLLPEQANRYPHEFSGGQRQRIGIARALVMEPELIIADEPVSALDVSIQAQVINLLNELKKSLGISLLFIAHDLSIVKYFSDRIAVMHRGKIVEFATSDELFANPLHPYTKSLLSAIPLPDPLREKSRQRILYESENYCISGGVSNGVSGGVSGSVLGGDLPTFKEVKKGHFVLCTKCEFDKLTRTYPPTNV